SLVAGGFVTCIASLGWDLVYELGNIQIYKFQNLDDTDMFLRLCFQNNPSRRNHISPCVGNSYDPNTGFITDEDSLWFTRNVASPQLIQWEFGYHATASYDNYSYSQGYSIHGLAKMVGSKYHCVFMTNSSSSANSGRINAVLPVTSFAYPSLNRPLII